MEIMQRSGPFLSLLLSLSSSLLIAATPDLSPGNSETVTGSAVIREMNIARQNPALYAAFLEQVRQDYAARGRLTGGIGLCTHEGVPAVDEATRFLRHTQPLPALALSPAVCLAAADHCREQAGGAIGHHDGDGSDPGTRMRRYGVAAQAWAENIAYGQRSARAIVMALIIDDGIRSRGHRKNIFNRNYNVAGAAYGSHARFGSVCSIDFAGGYGGSILARAGSDVGNAF